ncbi:LysR substrate-binding domain-containing protein [Inquilinus sp. CAU 1745]|uniref:LysR family transcriptional regulator n=1 Tax=Inquilinus sp. CAU 1745 TaxID=3140369 RepID=UPI00325BB3B0
MRRDQLTGIGAFAAVAERRSFTAAAAALGVSPSALSHAVRALEERLGIRLLDRSTRSVGLTEAGERYLARVRPALDELATAAEELDELRDTPSGVLRLDVSRPAYFSVLSPRLAAFRAAYPDIRLELTLADSLSDIVANGCDAGIRLGETLQQDMVAVRIGEGLETVIAAAPAYFAGRPKPLRPEDLAGHECLNFRFPSSGAIYRWEFEREGHEVDIAVPGAIVANDALVLRDMALAGLGLGYFLSDMVADDLASGRLVRVLEDWSPRFPGHCLYYSSRRLPPAKLRALIDTLRG